MVGTLRMESIASFILHFILRHICSLCGFSAALSIALDHRFLNTVALNERWTSGSSKAFRLMRLGGVCLRWVVRWALFRLLQLHGPSPVQHHDRPCCIKLMMLTRRNHSGYLVSAFLHTEFASTRLEIILEVFPSNYTTRSFNQWLLSKHKIYANTCFQQTLFTNLTILVHK